MSVGNGVCTSYAADNATGLVLDSWAIFQNFAIEGYNLASSQIGGLSDFNVAYHSWDASFAADGTLTGFVRPALPVLAPITPISSDLVPDVPTVAISPIVLDLAPTEPTGLANMPELNLAVNGPEPIGDQRPAAAPALDIPDAPTEPTLAVLSSPVLAVIEMPDSPIVTIEAFAEAVPEFDAPVPSGAIDFVEQGYASALKDGIEARISDMMAGEGLPPAIAAALYGQAMDREDESALALYQGVYEEFASRGFDAEPNGILGKRMLEVRQTNRGKRADMSREIFIQDQKLIIENIRFAVTSGLQLEGQMIQMHMAVQQRRFELAVKIQEVAIAVFGAHVQAFNARVSGFNARVEAYKAFLEGQKARVEVYKAQVEAAKVRGEMNEQLVRIYDAQIRAEVSKVEIYKAQVEGFRARIEAERTKIQSYSAQVDAYRAFVETYKIEWDAERTRIESEVSRGKIYQTLADVYATRVNVWQTKSEVRVQDQKSQLLIAQAYLQQHDAQVKTMLARLEAAKATLSAQIAQQSAAVEVYKAEASVESTAADVNARIYAANAARENQRLEILIKDAELKINQMNQNANLMLRAMESAAQASTQLSASAMSAVNFSAGTSSNLSRSEACSSSFSYSGAIDDAP